MCGVIIHTYVALFVNAGWQIGSIRCLKPLKSFESTWQIEDFSSHHVLIPSNIRRDSKTKKELRSGNIGSKSTEFVMDSDSIVTYTLAHSLTWKPFSKLPHVC